MKRKRDSGTSKKFKCRFRGCKGFTANSIEFFCIEHRKYITKIQNAEEIFYSIQNTLEIASDICVYILIMNIPHIDKIKQNINENSKTMRMINTEKRNSLEKEIKLLSKSDILDIHIYIFNVSLISKTIEREFKNTISFLYNKIFVLDGDNMVISYRNKTFPEYGGKSIMSNCALLAKNNKNGEFIWNDCNKDIMEYYKLHMNALHIQSEATKAKNTAEKKRDEIYLNLISKTKAVILNNSIVIKKPNTFIHRKGSEI